MGTWRARTPDLHLIELLQREVADRGQTRVVLGLSGGLDSDRGGLSVRRGSGRRQRPRRSCCRTALATGRACPRPRAIVNALGITSRRVNISPMVDAYFANFPDASRERRATRLAWERLAILHDFGAHYGGLVLQIVNRTDLALEFGRSRLPSPRGAAVRGAVQVAGPAARRSGGRPPSSVAPPARASYPAGQSDESELGRPYAMLDPALEWLVERGYAGAAVGRRAWPRPRRAGGQASRAHGGVPAAARCPDPGPGAAP